jgi:GH35 family endo-1,4-beta-xylanase
MPRHVLVLTLALVFGGCETGRYAPGAGSTAGSGAGAGASGRARVKLGAAVNHGYLFDASDPAYAATFVEEFDSLTPEYELKLDQLLPRQGAYDFAVADRLVAYAEQTRKEMRGHTLVWHEALPPWMLARSWTREELLALLEQHVTTVVRRYRGRLVEWDVVNEALADDGSWRHSIWYDVIGPDYVEAAFRFARAADPGARLYYNDYGAEWMNAKSDAILALAKRLASAGLIDGVGFQSHFTAGAHPGEAELAANLARFSAAGLEVAVTELDVRMGLATSTLDERLRSEADIYGVVARVCQAEPACKRVTTWGITDRHSWLPATDTPLLFDVAYARKPAYAAVRAALPR